MALRFRRTVKIAPGVRLNVGKKSASIRVGGKGFGVTSGSSGTHVSAGIPGTGVYATQKVGASKSRQTARSAPTVSAGSAPAGMSLLEVIRTVPPIEKGLGFPTWWLVGALVGVIGIPDTSGGTILLAVPCGYMAWRRLNSPAYRAMQTIRAAQKSPSESSDAAVRDAAAQAAESWTVQREAGIYFQSRDLAAEAASALAKAVALFPGDRKLYAILAAGAAIDAGHTEYAIQVLEPYLASADPEASDVDAVVVSALAQAILKQGDPARALEVVNRLPLRRRDLDPPLLLGLGIRALAKHALGQKAEAKRDLDRMYAIDPDFVMVSEVKAALEA